MFVWRIRHESLAICANLQRRGIKLENSKCLFCGRNEEDGAHLFIKCKHVKQIWRELGLEAERIELEKIRGVHAMLDSLWKLQETKRVLIVTLWWQWWNNRNKVREEEMPLSASEVVRRVRSSALEYEHVFALKQKEKLAGKWHPPNGDELKINLDGAFTPGSNFCGWGAVVRDAAGEVVAARAGRQENTQDAFGAEINAMAAAVSLAADIGAIRVVFETDSQLLVDAMDVRKVDSSPHAVIIEDIKFQLKLWFAHHSVRACRRNENSVAHELGQIGRMCLPGDCMEWNTIVPPSVAVCVLGDMPKHR